LPSFKGEHLEWQALAPTFLHDWLKIISFVNIPHVVIGSMIFKQLKPSWTSRMDNQVYQAAQSPEVIFFSIVFFLRKVYHERVGKSKFCVPIHFSKLWKSIMIKELFFKSTGV
jgi:hypothetical protein